MLATDTAASNFSVIFTLSCMDKLTSFPFSPVFLELTTTFPWDTLSPSLHYNGKIRQKDNYNPHKITCSNPPPPPRWSGPCRVTGGRRELQFAKIVQTTHGPPLLRYKVLRDHCICEPADPTWKEDSTENYFKGFQHDKQSSLQCWMYFLLPCCKLDIQAHVQDF